MFWGKPLTNLTLSSSHGMHSKSIGAESKNPTRKHLMELGDYFKVKNAGKIIDEVRDIVLNWKAYADQCEVNEASKNRIEKAIRNMRR